MTILSFRWSAFFADTPLFHVANRILSIVPHSANVERINSKMNFIHSKTRNRLHLEKVTKLMKITCNMGLQKVFVDDCFPFDADDESDVEYVE